MKAALPRAITPGVDPGARLVVARTAACVGGGSAAVAAILPLALGRIAGDPAEGSAPSITALARASGLRSYFTIADRLRRL